MVLLPVMAAGLVATGLVLGAGWATVKGVEGAVWAGGQLRAHWSSHCAALRLERERKRRIAVAAREHAASQLRDVLNQVSDIELRLLPASVIRGTVHDDIPEPVTEAEDQTRADSELTEDLRAQLRGLLRTSRESASAWGAALADPSVFADPDFAAKCAADAAATAREVAIAEALVPTASFAELASEINKLQTALIERRSRINDLPTRSLAVAELQDRAEALDQLLASATPSETSAAILQVLTKARDRSREVLESLPAHRTADIVALAPEIDEAVNAFWDRVSAEQSAILRGHVLPRLEKALDEVGFRPQKSEVTGGVKVTGVGEGGRSIEVLVDESLKWQMATRGYPGKTCEGVVQRLLDALRRHDVVIADENGPVRERFSHEETVRNIVKRMKASSDDLEHGAPEQHADGSVTYRFKGRGIGADAMIKLRATSDGWTGEEDAEVIGLPQYTKPPVRVPKKGRVSDG